MSSLPFTDLIATVLPHGVQPWEAPALSKIHNQIDTWRQEWEGEIEDSTGSSVNQNLPANPCEKTIPEALGKLESDGIDIKSGNTIPLRPLKPILCLREIDILTESAVHLLRVLRRRKCDPDRTITNLKSMVDYRATIAPVRSMSKLCPCSHGSESEVPGGPFRLGGFTKCGYPIVYNDTERWKPANQYGLEEAIRYNFHFLEAVSKVCGPHVDKFVGVFKMGAFSMEHNTPFALRCIQQLVILNQNVFTGRMAIVFLLNAPALFKTVWQVIKPWLDDFVVKKVLFVDEGKEAETLNEYIDSKVLWKEMGGQADYGESKYETAEEEVQAMCESYWKIMGKMNTGKGPALDPLASNPMLHSTQAGIRRSVNPRTSIILPVSVIDTASSNQTVTLKYTFKVEENDIGFEIVFIEGINVDGIPSTTTSSNQSIDEAVYNPSRSQQEDPKFYLDNVANLSMLIQKPELFSGSSDKSKNPIYRIDNAVTKIQEYEKKSGSSSVKKVLRANERYAAEFNCITGTVDVSGYKNGSLLFIFDNTYSWATGKVFYTRIEINDRRLY